MAEEKVTEGIYRSVNSVTFTYVLGYLCMVMSLAIHENIAYNSMLAIIKSIARMFETSIETFY